MLNRVHEELELLVEQESALEQDYQGASDHLQLVQNALRQQEKIERYQEDLEELNFRLEEQMMVVEEANERVMMAEERATISEEEVDSLKSQLADYQQALDVQQTVLCNINKPCKRSIKRAAYWISQNSLRKVRKR